jgi:Flp pilus assembly protein TadD
MLTGAPVAVVLSLLLAACQGAGPPDARAPGQSAEVLMRVADDAAANGDFGTAAGLYRRAAEASPEDPHPLAKLGATLLQLHAYTEAAATYRAALKLTPNPIEGELHRGLGVVLVALDQPESALVELDAAVAKVPQDARLYNALGVAHDLLGRHDLAQQDYRNGLRLAPSNAGLRNNYALSLALSRDYPGAVAELSELANGSDASPRHRLNLALIYGLAGDDKKAAALARTTLDEAAVANNLAYYAMLRGMDDKARANAIMGTHVGGATVAEALPKPDTGAEPVAAAPVAPVTATPLSQGENQQPNPTPVHRTKPVAPAKPAQTPNPTPPAAAPEQAKAEAAAAAPAPAEAPAQAAPVTTAAGPTGDAPSASAADKPAAAEPEPAPPKTAPDAAPAPAGASAMVESPKSAPAEPPPAAQEATAPPSPPPAPAAEPESVPAPVAAKPASAETADFVVQLGAFAAEPNAHKLADHLNQKGYEVAVVHRRDHDGRDWFIVRAGGYATAEEAGAAARHMREAEQVPAVVVHLRRPNQA